MTPERWQQVKQIFQSAIERPPSERDGFISQACADDPDLRSQVQFLISSYDTADDSFQGVAVNVAAQMIFDDEAKSLLGHSIGPYEVTERIGRGGMGEVFLAKDSRLARKVALKLLRFDVTQDKQRLERFKQEARAASALNHPNILTIYEIGEAGGRPFIATEFIEGETLRSRVENSRIEPVEATDVAIQIASGLNAAHEAGIVHRDIKPENIMLRRDGYVKILDFGLAKLVERQARGQELSTLIKTEEGVIMGTARYMSPEQARGQAVDARTDIWSLGVVLYEMLSGRTPFGGETPGDLIVSILEREPPPLARYSIEAPAELQRIVSKALRKDREERYQTSKDLQIDLRQLKQRLELEAEMKRSAQIAAGEKAASDSVRTRMRMVEEAGTQMGSRAFRLINQIKRRKISATLLLIILVIAIAGAFSLFHLASKSKPTQTSTALKALAVLPFRQLNPGSGDDYLGIGLADALITRLSNLSQIVVRPTDAVLKYAEPDHGHEAAGRELGADLILDGRIQRSGDDLRLTLQLVNVKDGRPLWADQFDEKFTDLFTIEDSISQKVAQALTLKLSGDEQQRLAKRSTENAEAYQEYLKGRFHMLQYTHEGFKNSVAHLNQAIALDPTYAMAYAGLADAYTTASNDYLAPREALPRAQAAALKALSFDEELAEAHAALGHAKFHGYDWSAEKDLQRALQLNPNSVPVLLWYGEYWALRDPIKAIPILQRAQQLDPLSLAVSFFLSNTFILLRQPDQAIKEAQKMIELDSNNPNSHAFLALAYAMQRNYPEAIAEFNKGKQLGAPPWALGMLGYVYAMSGKRDEARQVLAELSQAAKQQFVSPHAIASVYVGLGEKDQAFAWLEKAYEDRDELLGFMRFFFWMDPLRSDLRYAALMQRLGLEP